MDTDLSTWEALGGKERDYPEAAEWALVAERRALAGGSSQIRAPLPSS